ncbi:MAG: hypothetical protein ACRD5Z_26915, partial [Bryobacteraceae bacterium]
GHASCWHAHGKDSVEMCAFLVIPVPDPPIAMRGDFGRAHRTGEIGNASLDRVLGGGSATAFRVSAAHPAGATPGLSDAACVQWWIAAVETSVESPTLPRPSPPPGAERENPTHPATRRSGSMKWPSDKGHGWLGASGVMQQKWKSFYGVLSANRFPMRASAASIRSADMSLISPTLQGG